MSWRGTFAFNRKQVPQKKGNSREKYLSSAPKPANLISTCIILHAVDTVSVNVIVEAIRSCDGRDTERHSKSYRQVI